MQWVLSYNLIFCGASSFTLHESASKKQILLIGNHFKRNFPDSVSISKLYSSVKILKLHDLHKFNISKIIFMAVNMGKYPHITDHICSLTWRHNYGTRHVHPFRLPQARVLPDTNCFLFHVIKYYNSLPSNIRSQQHLCGFKSGLSEHLRREY